MELFEESASIERTLKNVFVSPAIFRIIQCIVIVKQLISINYVTIWNDENLGFSSNSWRWRRWWRFWP